MCTQKEAQKFSRSRGRSTKPQIDDRRRGKGCGEVARAAVSRGMERACPQERKTLGEEEAGGRGRREQCDCNANIPQVSRANTFQQSWQEDLPSLRGASRAI